MATPNDTTTSNTTPSGAGYPDEVLPSLVELFDPPSHSMCEFGDIMLVIEDGYHPQLRLRVNSCILSSTSNIFRALLRGCFAEGAAIRAGETREVYMNDHPTPMLALCQLLHHKPVEPALKTSDILEFALLVDKFDCVQPLKHATDSMLGLFDADAHSHTLGHEMVASAFILDQPTHFRRFTKALVHRSQGIYAPFLDPELQAITVEHLPATFTSKYQERSVLYH